MKFDLRAKGLLPDQLLQDPWPDDLLIEEAQVAFRDSPEFKALASEAAYPDKLQIHFCWKHRATGKEWRLAGKCTLGQWATTGPGIEALIIVTDGSTEK